MASFLRRHPVLTAYLYALSFSFIYHLLVRASGMAGSIGVRQSVVMSLIWLIPFLIWPQHPRRVATVLALILAPPSLMSFGYWLIYRQDFYHSVMFIIFESNLAEGAEFVTSYWRWWYLPAMLLYCSVPVALWRKLCPIELSVPARLVSIALVVAAVSWPFANYYWVRGLPATKAFNHQLARMEPASPWQLLIGYREYRAILGEMEGLIADNEKLPPLQDFTVDDSKLPERLVIVIGESTNRERMGLYGYGRDTTPRLDRIRNELTVFNNVITPRPFTIEALQQVLSFADQEHPKAFFDKPNMINLLKQAGYHITWITNQQTQTRRNTILTTLSEMADEQVYLNNNREQNARSYDEVVLDPFAAALSRADGKEAIIVHLLGTHRRYDRRYPDEFRVFDDREGVPDWVDDSMLAEYNAYDNSVLYNDYIVSSLIQRLDNARKRSLLVYFSDHGEDVYDTPKHLFTGRNEMAPSPPMYTVPFLTWSSSQQSRVTDWQPYVNRAFQTSDFIFTLADMIGVSFRDMDYSRSLVSGNYTARPRLIGNPDLPKTLHDYDKMNVLTASAQDKKALETGHP